MKANHSPGGSMQSVLVGRLKVYRLEDVDLYVLIRVEA